MLPHREVLVRLVKANVCFLLYGHKASGKTTLIRNILHENESAYIYINCTLANKRANFLKLFNVELNNYLCVKSEEFKKRDRKLDHPPNLDSWIFDLKKLLDESPDYVRYLDNLFIFMDNIEEMILSEGFLSSFYYACQKEFPFRFNFIFCGINFLKKEYTLEQPFRTMIAFAMPKPLEDIEKEMMKSAQAAIRLAPQNKKLDQTQVQRCAKLLTTHIKASFQNMELNLQKAGSITKSVIDTISSLIEAKDPYRSVIKMINNDHLKTVMSKIRDCGPLGQGFIHRKIEEADNREENEVSNGNLEYYPNLILASIHLADYYTEKEDKRRFQDYKSRTMTKNKDLKKNEFKVGRHNLNRIIAVAESLESQAKQNDKQQIMEHHTLDFYAQFEHLRKINRIKMIGNSKLTGMVKEEQARGFLKANELKYEQFMSTD